MFNVRGCISITHYSKWTQDLLWPEPYTCSCWMPFSVQMQQNPMGRLVWYPVYSPMCFGGYKVASNCKLLQLSQHTALALAIECEQPFFTFSIFLYSLSFSPVKKIMMHWVWAFYTVGPKVRKFTYAEKVFEKIVKETWLVAMFTQQWKSCTH